MGHMETAVREESEGHGCCGKQPGLPVGGHGAHETAECPGTCGGIAEGVLGDLTPTAHPRKAVSIEEIVRRCQGNCPLTRVTAELRRQLDRLERDHEDELRRMELLQRQAERQHEEELRRVTSLRQHMEGELAELREWHRMLLRWFRRKDGRLKKRWIIVASGIGAFCVYYWRGGGHATTPLGRSFIRTLERLLAWRDHMSAVVDDMDTMGPIIHEAARFVRLVTEAAWAPLSGFPGEPALVRLQTTSDDRLAIIY